MDPLTVLSITVMSEFLCSMVVTPFLLFMVRDFGVGQDEAEVGYWTGILVSVFFLSQFITSLAWASLADRFGRRNILCISLLGSTATCVAFGMQRTFQGAMITRLLQGIFGGAIGVARSGVGGVTDASNEGRVYAILGFTWGMGGVVGPVIGGALESPAQRWPALFGHSHLFHTYPYLLPCAVASVVTLTGATLCLFLDREGGPRNFTVPLLANHHEFGTTASTIRPRTDDGSRLVPPFPRRVETLSHTTRRPGLPFGSRSNSSFNNQTQPAISFAPEPEPRMMDGPSQEFLAIDDRRRRGGNASINQFGHSPTISADGSVWARRRSLAVSEQGSLNLAGRFIVANENRITSMHQLWVDAAIATEAASDDIQDDATLDRPLHTPATEQTPLLVPATHETGTLSHSPRHQADRSSTILYPAIFANSGVERSPAAENAMASEARRSLVLSETDTDLETGMEDLVPVSPWKQIPALLVAQYGLLALHTATHDQVFYSYLMTKYEAGGLGLTAAHFSQIIASMSGLRVFYQFYLYPNVGPPRGRLSHLSMFRIGSFLFIPGYMAVIFFRGWPESWVMSGLIASTGIRFCAGTFTFTGMTILLNYLTPAPAVGLANGLAQSIASLARFLGPAIGAKLWELSVKHNPNGFAFGFWVCAVTCAAALIASFTIR